MTDPQAGLQAHVVELRAGRSVTVRAIRPEDKDEFEAAFDRLSPAARYSRFFMPLRELPDKMLDDATNPSPDRTVALVALDGEGAAAHIVGGARFGFAQPGEAR